MNRSTAYESLKLPLRLVALSGGAAVFLKTASTPSLAYQSMIQLFCSTHGTSNDIIHRLLQVIHPPYSLPPANGVLGILSKHDVQTIAATLDHSGYYVFPNLLPTDICNRLLRMASTMPAMLLPRREDQPAMMVYDRERPLSTSYVFPEQMLLDNSDIQRLACDPSILAVAQAYLGVPPILDAITGSWSTAFAKTASSEAAQQYHFDLDRIKWLKFFFYLTDVTHESGPHVFVARSHRRQAQPAALMRRGYVRIPDSDIERYYPKADIVEITGQRGTIFAVDTRAFHKGKHLQVGDRLSVQMEFCDSLFGGEYKRATLKQSYSSDLLQMAARHTRIYAKYDIDKS